MPGGAGAALPAAGLAEFPWGSGVVLRGPAGALPSGTGGGKKRGRGCVGEDFVSPSGMAGCAGQAGQRGMEEPHVTVSAEPERARLPAARPGAAGPGARNAAVTALPGKRHLLRGQPARGWSLTGDVLPTAQA